ncbi:MAG: TIR domain-containing protein [Hyphomicrobiales bacterium]|nr:TIR domain-containing protein [Hyphomicrobiales bacterium]
MADVFISYKRERRPAARHLAAVLTHYGYSVWFDLALVRGADYEEQIQRELNAAKAVIVLWCGMAVTSPGVRSEASRAKEQRKLIPVKIEPCDLPLFSTLEQNIDLTRATGSPRDHAFDPILDDLERLVGRPPVADLKGLRDYETTWRMMSGGLSLANLPMEKVIVVETEYTGDLASPLLPGQSAHDYSSDIPQVALVGERLPSQPCVCNRDDAFLVMYDAPRGTLVS